ncbi:MAG: type VI secretion system contractile sheath large subunit [Planctomycetota bacterium]
MAEAVALDIKRFLTSMRLGELKSAPTPMIQDNLQKVTEEVSDEDRFVSGLAALVFNCDAVGGKFDKGKLHDTVKKIDAMVQAQVNEVIHNEKFQHLESTWRSLDDIIQHTNFRANVMIDMLDVSKAELAEDFENNSVDLTGGALFKKAYVSEYDQYGGKPFGIIVGLYEFEHNPKEIFWLRQMAKVAAVAHAPFVSAVSPKFFGCNSAEELGAIKDLTGLLSQPKYGAWNAFRDSPEAAYVCLTVPRYILRLPWHPVNNPCGDLAFTEDMAGADDKRFLWGNAAVLFTRNMIRSFEKTGWCQHVRGPKGGGLIAGLPAFTYNTRGQDELKIPVEVVIPDYRELEFANAGFAPLVYRKGTADACFFSVQSLKMPKKFKNAKDSENSQLVTNLSYTMSITRIAHYVKCMMRDNIGSTADAAYCKNQIESWIGNFVTKVTNPDDLTLACFPFKAATVEVKAQEGLVGMYSCTVSVLPHIQFEGMDCELRLESRLG